MRLYAPQHHPSAPGPRERGAFIPRGVLPGSAFDGFVFTGPTRPGTVSPGLHVPATIPLPEYALDGAVKAKKQGKPWEIQVKTEEEIEGIREAGSIARRVLDAAGRLVKPGITTEEIDALVHNETIRVRPGVRSVPWCGVWGDVVVKRDLLSLSVVWWGARVFLTLEQPTYGEVAPSMCCLMCVAMCVCAC